MKKFFSIAFIGLMMLFSFNSCKDNPQTDDPTEEIPGGGGEDNPGGGDNPGGALVSLIFLKRSLVFPILLFSSISFHSIIFLCFLYFIDR